MKTLDSAQVCWAVGLTTKNHLPEQVLWQPLICSTVGKLVLQTERSTFAEPHIQAHDSVHIRELMETVTFWVTNSASLVARFIELVLSARSFSRQVALLNNHPNGPCWFHQWLIHSLTSQGQISLLPLLHLFLFMFNSPFRSSYLLQKMTFA